MTDALPLVPTFPAREDGGEFATPHAAIARSDLARHPSSSVLRNDGPLEWLAVPAALVVAAAFVAVPDSMVARTVVVAAVAALAVWIAWRDLATFTISDAALVSLGLLAAASRWPEVAAGGADLRAVAVPALDALLPGGMLLAFREIYYRRKGVDGLGLGDVKLGAAGGLLVGAIGFSWALAAASLLGLTAVAVTRWLAPGRSIGDRLAFGAILAPALFVVWIATRLPFPSFLSAW